MLRRRRVELKGSVILEPKYDGYLVAAMGGEIYSILGRPAPKWLRAALYASGAVEPVYEMMRDGFVIYLEVFGRRLTPNGYHSRHTRDYDAVVLDVAWIDDHGRQRFLPPEKAADAAELYGLRFVEYRYEERDVLLDPPMSMAEVLRGYRGWEGYVAKLYAAHGHKLPPDYGARLRGALMVKARWEALGRLLG